MLGLALAALAAAPAAAPAATAEASANCRMAGFHRSLGTSYVHRLSVSRISCRTGRSLVRSYNACRRRNGGLRGRCPVFGSWRCAEFRRSSRYQFDATTSCRSGVRRFVVAYTQNT